MLNLEFDHAVATPKPTYVPETTFWWTIIIIGIIIFILIIVLVVKSFQIDKLEDEIKNLKKENNQEYKKDISLEDISKQLDELKEKIH